MRPIARYAIAALSSFCFALPATSDPLRLGDIVVTNASSIDVSESPVVRVSAAGAQSLLSRLDLLRSPYRVTRAPDGRVYVAERDRLVFEVDPISMAQRAITRSFEIIYDIEAAANGDVFVLAYDSLAAGYELSRLDPSSGDIDLVSSLSGLDLPIRIAVAPNDDVYVLDDMLDEIFLVQGDSISAVPTPYSVSLGDIAYDAASADLFGYSKESVVPFIIRIDPVTGAMETVTWGGVLTGAGGCCLDRAIEVNLAVAVDSAIEVDPATGHLLALAPGLVVRVDPATGAQLADAATISDGSQWDIGAAADGSYHVVERASPIIAVAERLSPILDVAVQAAYIGGATVVHYEPSPGPSTGAWVTIIAETPPFHPSASPDSVAISQDGLVLVVVDGVIVEIDPGTGEHRFPVVRRSFSMNYPGRLEVEPSGDALLVSTYEQIVHIEGGLGAATEVTEGVFLSDLRSIARRQNGEILALDSGGLYRVFADGSQALMSSGQEFSGAILEDLAVAPDGLVYVTDSMTSSVIEVDPSEHFDSNQKVVATGGVLNSPKGVAAESNGNLVVASNASGCIGVARVNPANGGSSCLADGDRLENPWGIAVYRAAPEPAAALLQLASLGTLVLLGRRRRR